MRYFLFLILSALILSQSRGGEITWKGNDRGGEIHLQNLDIEQLYAKAVTWAVFQEKKLRALKIFIASPTPAVSVYFVDTLFRPVDTSRILPMTQTPSVRYAPLGWQRGVCVGLLTISPFRFNPSTESWEMLSSARISVQFESGGEKTAAFGGAVPPLEKSIFRYILNNEQIATWANRRTQTSLSDEIPILPYPKGKLAVKLLTSRDGIAFVPASEIIGVEAKFRNQDYAVLHLYYRGKKVPYGVVGDTDGKCNDGDTLFFLGFHPSGDTVWFNTYALHTAFFFIIDSSSTAIRYGDWDDEGGNYAAAERVYIWEHFEEDHFISTGYRAHTTGDEEWSWTPGIPPGEEHQFQLELFPADSMVFRCQYRAVTDNRYYNPDHYAQFFINTRVIAERIFNGWKDDTLVAHLAASEVLQGKNVLRFYSAGVPEYRDRTDPPYTDLLYLDYYEVEGWALPVAMKNVLRGYTSLSEMQQKMQIFGFTSPRIVAIDTTRGLFASFDRAEPGISISMSSVQKPRTSAICFNGDCTVYDSSANGYGVVVLPDSPNAEIFPLPDELQNFLSTLQQGGAETVVGVLWNAQNPMPQALVQALQNLGFVKIQDYRAGMLYGGIAQVGNPERREQLDSFSIGITQFYPQRNGRSYRIALPFDSLPSWFIVAGKEQWEKAEVRQSKIRYFRDYSGQVDYLIITHERFWNEANRLAHYRQVKSAVSTLVVDVESLYDEFSFGEKRPEAIRSFLKAAFARWQSPAPSYLLLFGDASWDPRKVADGSVNEDYVPSYGKPVSDYWFTLLDPAPDVLPELLVGRIPVSDSAEAAAVVDKILEYESLPQQPWMRHALFLTGGENEQERFFFRFDAEQIIGYYLFSTPLCMTAEIISKAADGNVDNSNATRIQRAIDRGALWVNYFGHAAPTIFDMDFGWAADLNNAGKYPILATFSCQTGAFAEPNVVAKNEDFLRAAQRGMIACYGTTGFGYVALDRGLARGFFQGFRDSAETFGALLHAAKMYIFIENDTIDPYTMAIEKKETFWQYSLLGDPLGIPAYRAKTDPYLRQQDFVVTNGEGNHSIVQEDSLIRISGVLRNGGLHWRDTLQIRIVHFAVGRSDTIWYSVPELCEDREFELLLPSLGIAGNHRVELWVNPDSSVAEANYGNNYIALTFPVFSSRLNIVDPLPYWNVDQDHPRFRILSPVKKDSVILEWRIEEVETGRWIDSSFGEDVERTALYCEWKPQHRYLERGKRYRLWVRSIDGSTQIPGEWLSVPFTVDTVSILNENVRWNFFHPADWQNATTERMHRFANGMGLALRNKKVPMEIYSDGRGSTRWVRVNIAGIDYVNSPFLRGFNVFVIPPDDSVRSVYRRYDTYMKDAQIQKDVYGDSEELVKFLRDSVRAEDRIIIALCDNSRRGIDQKGEEPGNWNDVVTTLQLYGAEYADSLRYGSSYILVAQRGKKLFELWKRETEEGNTAVELKDSLEVVVTTGSVTLPPIHAVAVLRTVSLQTNGVGQWKIIVRKEGQPSTILWTSEGQTHILPDITVGGDAIVQIHVEKSAEEEPQIYGVELQYTPLPEVAVLPRQINDTTVRGYLGAIPYAVANLSLRQPVDSVLITSTIASSNQSTEYQQHIPSIPPDNFYSDTVFFPTLLLGAVNQVNIRCMSYPQDLYDWNNAASSLFIVENDTIPPTAQLFFDSSPWMPDMIVQQLPHVLVRLWDNVPISVSSDRITLLVNGVDLALYDSQKVQLQIVQHPVSITHQQNQFLLYDFSFYAPLRVGANVVAVVVEDYFGNRDTLQYSVHVPSQFKLQYFSAYPIPVSNGELHYEFTIEERVVPKVEMHIYSLHGHRVYAQELPVKVGKNHFTWNCSDYEGRRVSSGYYILVLFVWSNSGELVRQSLPIIVLP